jgi:two-component system, OmpR family, sensor histidine kinase ArlS
VRFPEKNISLEANLTDDYTLSPCNRSLLFTMFFNLINNAIKYNKQDGKIIVSTGDIRQFEVRIQDTGKGIATENLQSIFYRFKKFNSAGEESYGLGLPMVKTIADFHGMEIKVDSILGQGSVFTVVIKTDE